jgi:sialate O-acetylesterase
VVDTGGAGGFVGSPSELWLGVAGDAGARVELAGAWRSRTGSTLPGARPGDALGPNTPTVLYNAMIAPLLRTPLRGAIFYQGESNVGAPLLYRRLFPAMIGAWRTAFAVPDLPFYYVQIAPFAYGGVRGKLAAFLREAQALAMTTCSNVGMAVTMDIGDPRDIHPLNKQDVGKRLALWALAETYRRPGFEPRGPALAEHVVEGETVRLMLTHAAGLTTTDGQPPRTFALAGEDRVFHEAQAEIAGDGVVLVRCAAVPRPVAVRYAFGDGDVGTLVNGAGLPASSFRTDDWPPPER